MQDFVNQVQSILRDVLNQDTLVISAETTAKDVKAWDSIAHIHIMLAIEEHFRIRFSTAEVTGLRNIGHLVTVIQRKLST